MSKLRREHFRGVIWPRPPGEKEPLHRYLVVGMIVSKEPIPEFTGHNEIVLDGSTFGNLADALGGVPRYEPSGTLGDASSVLLRLETIVGKRMKARKTRRRKP